MAFQVYRRRDGRKDDHDQRDDYVAPHRIDFAKPRGFSIRYTPSGHLGWGLGAAIGTKLGAPDATVIAAEGDGSYIFGAPTACHFTAQKYRIPFLAVIYNNQAWNASINAARGLYPEGVAQRTRNFPGCDLSPSPQFELTAQACGAYAERVEEPDEVPRALERALKVMKEERRQSLLNVVCKNPLE